MVKTVKVDPHPAPLGHLSMTPKEMAKATKANAPSSSDEKSDDAKASKAKHAEKAEDGKAAKSKVAEIPEDAKAPTSPPD